MHLKTMSQLRPMALLALLGSRLMFACHGACSDDASESCSPNWDSSSLLQHHSHAGHSQAQAAPSSSRKATARVNSRGEHPCQTFNASTVTEESIAWCDPSLVPADKRVPEKLQGFFYMSGLDNGEKFLCLSLGTWNEAERALTVESHPAELWGTGQEAKLTLAILPLLSSNDKLVFTFSDDSLTEAVISTVFVDDASGAGAFSLGGLAQTLFNKLMTMTYILNQDAQPLGSVWKRNTVFLNLIPVPDLIYNFVRIFDGQGVIDAKANSDMISQEGGGTEYNRYRCP